MLKASNRQADPGSKAENTRPLEFRRGAIPTPRREIEEAPRYTIESDGANENDTLPKPPAPSGE